MFEDYTFSFPLPDSMKKFTPSVLLSLVGTVVGFGIAGYGLFHVLFLPQETPPASAGMILGTTTALGTIYVDVSGAVEKPGLYHFQTGERVAHALEKAGGLSVEADTTFMATVLNTARKLNDGEKLYVPFAGELGSTSSGEGVKTPVSSSSLISINTASQKELETLPQIGEKRATDIIQNRPYGAVSELTDKGVVTEKIFTEIQSLISL